MKDITLTLDWQQFLEVVRQNNPLFDFLWPGLGEMIETLVDSDGNLSEEAYNSSSHYKLIGKFDQFLDYANEKFNDAGITVTKRAVIVELFPLAC